MLCEPDVKAIIRLLGEVSILDADMAEKRRFLLSGLCELIDADQWVWTLDQFAGNQTEALTLENVSGGRMPPLSSGSAAGKALALASSRDGAFTAHLSGSSSVSKFVSIEKDTNGSNSTDIVRLTLMVRQVSDNVMSSIKMARRKGRPAFSPREIKMAQIILSEIPWLHEKDIPTETSPLGTDLSPRQRATFVYLMDGLGRQAIANRLHLSPHTVHGYIKDIYRHYRVNSRAELLKQFTALRGSSFPA